MAIFTISKAISTNIKQSVAVSELKHNAKITDLKLTLARKAALRLDEHAKLLTEARMEHVNWLANADETTKSVFETSKADLIAAISGAPTSA